MIAPSWHEQPVVFACEGSRLIGIVACPEIPAETGVVIIVGGPQYRAGSHRQFTLLARHLAEQGIASIRFDYRGMGDSEGDMRHFEVVGTDIRAAIDTLITQVPSIARIALWGLCDAASAALYYVQHDTRVNGLVLLNPWVHSAALAARARLKNYYLARLMQRSFWIKLLTGKFSTRNALGDLNKSVKQTLPGDGAASENSLPANPLHGSPGYVERMLLGLRAFNGDTLFLLSGNDLTAQEFVTLTKQDKNWRAACRAPSITRKTLAGANHTFSTQAWRTQAENWTIQWLQKADAP